jgi:LPXTG-motif cell wall-anchored protein
MALPALLVMALAGAVVPAPAAAQTEPLVIEVAVPDVVVPTGGASTVTLTLVANRDAEVERLAFAFDTGGLAGVATIDIVNDERFECTAAAELTTCETFGIEVFEVAVSYLDIEVTADSAAVPGATGELGVTAEATGAEPAASEATVAVAAPVDLVGGEEIELTSAPGGTVALPFTVSNAGPDDAHGVALYLNNEIEIDPATRHGDCVYFDGDPVVEHALCTFDVVLEPGATYAFGTPFEVDVRPDARAPQTTAVVGSWLTPAEAATMLAGLTADAGEGTPGTGPELALVEVGGGAPAPLPADPVPAADPDPEDNGVLAFIELGGDNPSDFSAVGDSADGESGDTVTVRVGVRNLGPALADAARSGEPVNRVRVTIPEGTSALGTPESCFAVSESVFRCSADERMLVGETELFEFALRIDRVIPDATGKVEVNRPPAEDPPPTDDGNPDNDTAAIVVNPTAGGGGGLPTTGTAAGAIAGIGVALVVLGGIALLLVRRRRFVA